MSDYTLEQTHKSEWFAIKTRQDFRAEVVLSKLCDEVFFPKKVVYAGNKQQKMAVIPHVLFIRTTREIALALEKESWHHPELLIPFWIYRYPTDDKIQVISQRSIDLLRLLTADGATKCKIYDGSDFQPKEFVRVTGGIYKGYVGYVQRVKKNKHVIVRIEGVCLVILPYIPPDLLEKIN